MKNRQALKVKIKKQLYGITFLDGQYRDIDCPY